MPALGRQRQVGLSEFQDSLDLHREKSKTKEIVFEKIIFNYMNVSLFNGYVCMGVQI